MKKSLLQGIDRFDFSTLAGERVALLTNYTAIDKNGIPLVKKAVDAGVDVTCIFSPEHGFFPVAQDMESVEKHNKIQGIPVYSLYGSTEASLRPDPALFDMFDIVVYDIQDIGSRYYTYLATLAFFMDALQKKQRRLIILDRVNPIGGEVEGAMLDAENYRSFVGYIPLLHRHGLTTAEIACYYYRLKDFSFPIEVFKVLGLKRSLFYDEYDYPWVPTSPNMPTVDAAVLYPGGCLVEGTTLSEGRGTTMPFNLVGAPGIDPMRAKCGLDELELPGISFIPMEFRPMFQKHSAERCGGVYISVTDRRSVRPLRAFIAILQYFRKVMGDSGFFRDKPYEFIDSVPAVDLLLGDRNLIEMFRKFADPDEIGTYLTAHEEAAKKYFSDFRIYV